MGSSDEVTLKSGEAKEMFLARSSFYRMLSSVYYTELEQEQIDALSKQDWGSCLGSDPLFDEGIADIRRYLRITNSGTRQELAVDYARCIIGAGAQKGTKAVLPYESLYTSEAGLLMQEARDEVFRAYKRSRLRLGEGIDVPDDHLSFMLEYLAVLTDRSWEAFGRNDETAFRECLAAQGEFLDTHVLNWIDEFCDDFRTMAKTRFYRGIAKMTQAFLHGEREIVRELTGDSALPSARAPIEEAGA